MKIKSLHLFALAIAMAVTTAFVSTGSSHERLTRYYYYDNDGAGTNPKDWHNTPPATDLELTCQPVPENICSAEFDFAPSGYPVSNGATASSIDAGLYQ